MEPSKIMQIVLAALGVVCGLTSTSISIYFVVYYYRRLYGSSGKGRDKHGSSKLPQRKR